MNQPMGETMTSTEQPPAQWKTWHKVTLSIVGVLFVLILAVAVLAPDPEPPADTPAQALADADDITGKPSCAEGDCKASIEYTPTGFGSDKNETIEATKDAQRAAWEAKPAPTTVEVTVLSDIVSTGGKESKGPTMVVSCTREAAREIDWDNVTAEGIATICDAIPQIKFDD